MIPTIEEFVAQIVANMKKRRSSNHQKGIRREVTLELRQADVKRSWGKTVVNDETMGELEEEFGKHTSIETMSMQDESDGKYLYIKTMDPELEMVNFVSISALNESFTKLNHQQ